jgi:hypothetical protein
LQTIGGVKPARNETRKPNVRPFQNTREHGHRTPP